MRETLPLLAQAAALRAEAEQLWRDLWKLPADTTDAARLDTQRALCLLLRFAASDAETSARTIAELAVAREKFAQLTGSPVAEVQPPTVAIPLGLACDIATICTHHLSDIRLNGETGPRTQAVAEAVAAYETLVQPVLQAVKQGLK